MSDNVQPVIRVQNVSRWFMLGCMSRRCISPARIASATSFGSVSAVTLPALLRRRARTSSGNPRRFSTPTM